MTGLINTLIPYGVVLLQVGALVLLLGLIFARDSQWVRWVGQHALILSFLITLAATCGSLFYSSILGYTPCLLCWWQRIFHFPQVILFGIALWHRRRDLPRMEDSPPVFLYTTALSIIGSLFAIYHILLPYLAASGIDCGSSGVSCTKQYVLEFGYITIPVMSLTVFATLILLAISSQVAKINK